MLNSHHALEICYLSHRNLQPCNQFTILYFSYGLDYTVTNYIINFSMNKIKLLDKETSSTEVAEVVETLHFQCDLKD